MKSIINITNEDLYNETVVSVDTTGLIGLNGTISVETEKEGWKDFTGEHGEKDYEPEYGFVLEVQL